MSNRALGWLALPVLVLLVFPIVVVAEEIVVRNDSLDDFNNAYIVGDFSFGEHAGVQLQSPCDGAIVGIQILWLEGTPGNPPSLEEAIHIYQGGAAFPTPGAELLLLEGPQMLPGYMNEFRHVDEQQTIPINVPVAQNERFYVTFEFYNPTNVGGGSPSVVRDTDGCSPQSNVLYGDFISGWGWYDFCIVLSGDLVIRAIIDCPGATGACCHAGGVCEDGLEADECAEFGDVWYEGQDCADVTCEPRGACCRQGGCLQLTTPDLCASIDGSYAGNGTNCDDDVCVPGACCFEDTGDCQIEVEVDCLAAGGAFQGAGTICDPNPCPQPLGACCFGEACLPDQTMAQCSGAGGSWGGPGSTCIDADGDGVPDACESITTGDVNCDGLVNAGDIDAFVLALTDPAGYASAYPGCDIMSADCNGDGFVNAGDIDAFVNLLVR